MKSVDAILVALADPMRRGVIDLLRKRPRRAGEIAEHLGLTRPAMSRHLRVLRTSGLIEPASDDADAVARAAKPPLIDLEGEHLERIGDRVRVETFVRVPIADAFEVFTLEIDQWWLRGPRYRVGGTQPGTLHLEPRLGGRIFEEYGAEGSALHEIGAITAWDPPAHFAFTWRGINFAPSQVTVVDVRFVASGEGTRVTVEHRGFAALPDDHPARHGKPVDIFIRDLGMWWGALLTSLRERGEDRP